jgi:hypothetical protein
MLISFRLDHCLPELKVDEGAIGPTRENSDARDASSSTRYIRSTACCVSRFV